MSSTQKRAARNTVLNWVKKAKEIKPLKETLKKYKCEYNFHLVFDELWTFIGRKSNKVIIWIAKCIETKQVLAYHTSLLVFNAGVKKPHFARLRRRKRKRLY